jgi:hypothetical protein
MSSRRRVKDDLAWVILGFYSSEQADAEELLKRSTTL